MPPNRPHTSGPGGFFWKSLTCCCPTPILNTQNTKKLGKKWSNHQFWTEGTFPYHTGWLMNIQSVKTMLWDTPQSYPIAHPGILADFQETSPFSEAGSWSTGLISAHSRMGHHVSKAGIQQLLPNLKFFPQATYSIFLWLKQTNKQKNFQVFYGRNGICWKSWMFA